MVRKMIGSNNFVADYPPESKVVAKTVLQEKSSTSSEHLASRCFKKQETSLHNIFVGSWNVGGVVPPDDLEIHDWLFNDGHAADIYVLGFQEIVPLNAANIICSNSKISMKWSSLIGAALNDKRSSLTPLKDDDKNKTLLGGYSNKNLDPRTNVYNNAERDDDSYNNNETRNYFECIVSKQMVGIYITIWVKSELCPSIKHLNISSVGCGFMGCLGNKGSVSARFYIHETSFCFVCSHLASGGKDGDEKQRNANAADILCRTTFPRGPSRNLPAKIQDHDRVVWIGDLNYRINLSHTTTRSLVQQKEWNMLLEKDQLKDELADGNVFEGWHEGTIKFEPTYKYYPNSESYYGGDKKRKGEKKRAPAWCDRIIWRGDGLKLKEYNRGELRLSDHRPVWAIFTALIAVNVESTIIHINDDDNKNKSTKLRDLFSDTLVEDVVSFINPSSANVTSKLLNSYI